MDLLTLTYNYDHPGVLGALSALDLLLSFVWILIVLLALYLFKSGKQGLAYHYMMPLFFFKLLGLGFFIAMYVYYYHGGDGSAYWSVSNGLVDLSLTDFSSFLKAMGTSMAERGTYNEFLLHNIPYPSWITAEPEGFFTGKIGWFFDLISGKNFLLMSLYFMLFAFIAHWKLYQFIVDHYKIGKKTYFHWLFLFIPSIAFWNTALTKDALVFIGIAHLLRHLLLWVDFKERSLKRLLWMIFYSWLIIKVRGISFSLLFSAFFVAWLMGAVNRLESRTAKLVLRLGLVLFGVVLVLAGMYFLQLDSLVNTYLNEAQVNAEDFAQNSLYTGARYDLGITDFSLSGMIKVAPLAIVTGIFRPFIYEAMSATLILNGIEGTLFLWLFFKKFLLHLRSALRHIINSRILLFSLIFVLMYAFATGFSSIIFGVLVRLRAPLLAFLVIVIYWKDFEREDDPEESVVS